MYSSSYSLLPPTKRTEFSSSSPPLHLPRTLARPHFSEVSRDAIRAVAPDLADVPPEYIRRGLRIKAPLLQSAIASLSPSHLPPSLQKSHLPPFLSIPVRHPSSSASYPTHILALSPSKPSGPGEPVHLMPVHAIVLATHCASLPRLPPTPPASPTPGAAVLTLPVLPLTLPSPAAFPLLHSFIYNHAISPLLSALIPLPPTFTHALSTHHAHAVINEALASGPKLHQLSTFLCAHAGSSLQTLTTHAGHVTALWRTTAALGLYDPELWDAMDLAWEVVLGALNLAASQ